MNRERELIFRCYECDRLFTSMKNLRSHELFDHGHFVGNCEVNEDKINKIKSVMENERLNRQKERRKEYLNSDHFKSLRRKHYQNNKERISNEFRRHYLKNKEKYAKKHSEYYQKNKEEIKRKKNQDYHKNKEEINRKRREKYQKNKGVLSNG